MKRILLLLLITACSAVARGDTTDLGFEQTLDAALIGLTHPRESWTPNPIRYWNQPYRLRDYNSVFLIKFDLAAIPATNRIVTAELGIYVQGRSAVVNSGHLNTKVGIWRMLVGWGRGVCWESRGGKDEKSWGKPGGKQAGQDRAQQATDTPLLKSENSWLKFNVRADVEAILGGEPNHGWSIENVDAMGDGFEFVTPISGDPRYRPTLIITHQPK